MTQEQTFFFQNIDAFLKEIDGQQLLKISLKLDKPCGFEFEEVPFQFEYVLSLLLRFENFDYQMLSAQTSDGLDTLWTQRQKAEWTSSDNEKVIEINEYVSNPRVRVGAFGFVDRVMFSAKLKDWTFIPAEIYGTKDGSLRYVVNDEMIFAFDSLLEVEKFEKEITNPNKT